MSSRNKGVEITMNQWEIIVRLRERIEMHEKEALKIKRLLLKGDVQDRYMLSQNLEFLNNVVRGLEEAIDIIYEMDGEKK